ncbi:hypothetical protein H2198_006886 [Neophaeococcomyces mojaviensis]|uniref:Uncharacterized protein n=1 Tax=Neophaeococcomyces mojaviensis TaxID=3383035 RepID=A0ACC3A1N9_9EURO|nr:hypothetical protein H2198_006886 [Knufia sp. JES_112]
MLTHFDKASKDSSSPFQHRPMPDEFVDYGVGDVAHLLRLFQFYRPHLQRRFWQTVKAESHKQVARSQEPQYDPQDKGKWKGPFRYIPWESSQTSKSLTTLLRRQREKQLMPDKQNLPVNPVNWKVDKDSGAKKKIANGVTAPVVASLTRRM